ncbi:MAG: hypothetical protein COU71_03100 [Parcubacteria group bacterium CG10_big_fil_rev_8_21_14_0_10_38_31]|nr:MAG: hypothetical protein COU71_03100 [Parcubacteria group bacterium CG10_big_fil_rev_8_21_14_0_10_38_31]
MELNISIAPEIIFYIKSFPVTNSLLWSLFISAFLILVTLILRFSLKMVPGGLQSCAEVLIEESFNFVKSVIGSEEKAKKVFPLFFTLFIFILAANLFTFIPGQSAITIKNGDGVISVFRAVMADYGMVLVLTIISVIIIQVVAIATHGPWGYLGKFLNFKSPLKFFLGVMDIVGEIAKILSLSFRLFGNIFAGEVLGMVMLFLIPFIAPLPFMFLGVLTAIVQAFVFATLTLVFITLASEIEPDELIEQASI